jgi:competence protein ComEC
LADPTFTNLAHFNEAAASIDLIGVISDPIRIKGSSQEIIIAVEKIRLEQGSDWLTVNGGVRVITGLNPEWQFGDRVFLSGNLLPSNSDQLSYRAYQQRRGFESEMFYPSLLRVSPLNTNPFLLQLFRFRKAAINQIEELYPEPASALLSGILLGDETRLSDDLKEDFNRTGTRHVIAISGFNIAVISALILSLVRRVIGPLRGRWIALFAIIAYTVLVGADAAVTRAAVMSGIALLARQSGRIQDGVVTLLFSAAVMALFSPLIIWDIGFQLSFSATLGIVLFAERFSNWTLERLERLLDREAGQKILPWVTDSLLLTLAAQITTTPILIYYFHRFSISSFPSNFLILPLQPAIMILGGLSVLTAFALFPLAQLIAWTTWPLLAFTIRSVEFFSNQDWASNSVGQYSIVIMLASYALIAWFARKPLVENSEKQLFFSPGTIMIGAVFATILLWLFALSQPNLETKLSIFGDNESAYVIYQSAEGRNIVFNFGAFEDDFPAIVQRELPFFNQEIDWLILSGNTYDFQFQSILDRLAVTNVALISDQYSSFEIARYFESAKNKSVPLVQISQNSIFQTGIDSYIDLNRIGNGGSVFSMVTPDYRAAFIHLMKDDAINQLIANLPISENNVLFLISENGLSNSLDESFYGFNNQIVVTNTLSSSIEYQDRWLSYLDMGWIRLSIGDAKINIQGKTVGP